MKRLLTLLTIILVLGATSATAMADPPWARRHDGQYIDHARVLSVTPIMQRVERPRRVCREEPTGRYYTRDGGNRTAGTLLGAVIGGVLGNTVGKGDGRVAATTAGAVIGGAIGNRASSGDDRYVEHQGYVQRCRDEVSYGRDRVVGYDVTYRYHGRIHRTRMDHDPGRWMRVVVDDRVRPAE